MKVVNDFEEYQILSLSDGRKVENWNGVVLDRPDPEVIWKDIKEIKKIDAKYNRSNKGGGEWINTSAPSRWQIHYKDLTFNLKLMGFKHTGLFPEQAYNWNIIINKIKESKTPVKVLNLFAYTGGASIAALWAGASVVHVDSSRGMIDWAKENVKSSNLEDKPIRFLVDDVKKFVKREIRRENKYDIIIMDPPSFGRGNKNEVWDIEKDLFNLVQDCTELLSDTPIMFLINSYTTGLSMTTLENILKMTVNSKFDGTIDKDELGLKANNGLILPCGIYARWENKK